MVVINDLFGFCLTVINEWLTHNEGCILTNFSFDYIFLDLFGLSLPGSFFLGFLFSMSPIMFIFLRLVMMSVKMLMSYFVIMLSGMMKIIMISVMMIMACNILEEDFSISMEISVCSNHMNMFMSFMAVIEIVSVKVEMFMI